MPTLICMLTCYNRLQECILWGGVNVTTHGLDAIIQMKYSDTDHMLIPGVNGTIFTKTTCTTL